MFTYFYSSYLREIITFSFHKTYVIGANPTLRDNGRGLRADQWARFCGRYICADVIEKHARQRLLERSTSYGNWGSENEMGARILLGKVMPVPQINPQTSHGK